MLAVLQPTLILSQGDAKPGPLWEIQRVLFEMLGQKFSKVRQGEASAVGPAIMLGMAGNPKRELYALCDFAAI